jgi:hypothetical protein
MLNETLKVHVIVGSYGEVSIVLYPGHPMFFNVARETWDGLNTCTRKVEKHGMAWIRG